MAVKPGYKQTEVGVIPEDWDVEPLGELSDFVTSGSRGWAQFYSKSGALFIRSQNVRDGRLSFEDVQYVSPPTGAEGNRTKVQPNDLLVTITGNSVGNVAFVEQTFDEAYISQHVGLARLKEPTRGAYICRYLSPNAPGNPQIAGSQSGQSKPGLNLQNLKDFRIALPPTTNELHAIAEALSDMDALLDGLNRLITKKRDLKQAAMQQLLTGQTRLPGFHDEWEVKRLGSVGECLRGVSYKGDSDLSTHDTAHTKRLLRSNNVQNAMVVTEEVQFVNAARVSSHQVLNQGDILVCMANGSKALVGKAGIFTVSDGHEYTFGAFMGCFRTNSAKANPAFAFYLFLTGRYREYINNLLAGSSINNLRPSSIESLEFPLPPLPEQTAIAAVLTDTDFELTTLEQRRDKTRALKQGMLQELLTGRTRLV
jgi:type I restriction enzyme S subunit